MTSEDFAAPPQPLYTSPVQWSICEDIDCTDLSAANKQAIDALHNGAEALRFLFHETPDAAALGQLLEGIYIDYIGLHFAGPGVAANPGALLAALQRIAKGRSIDTRQLKGSLGYAPEDSLLVHDWRYTAELVEFARDHFPDFKIISLEAPLAENGIAQLSALLHHGNICMTKLQERNIAPALAAKSIQFTIATGKSYFVEIARIKAFKILWLNVLRGWNAPLEYPAVAAVFQPAAYGDDLYTNMVRGTTMAMSAVLGGADRLTVLPYDAGRESEATYSQAFSRRIARNVQHLLKMESYLDRVTDPAAGSYYVEQLTQQIAQATWKQFAG